MASERAPGGRIGVPESPREKPRRPCRRFEPPDGGFDDAAIVVDSLRSNLADGFPPCLASAKGEWRDPYLNLRLTHDDGTTFETVHGDGYTAITMGPIEYKHYLSTEDVVQVLGAALAGSLVYARRGFSYFEMPARPGERVGQGGLTSASLAELLPIFGSQRTIRYSVSFQRSPAIQSV